MADGPKYVVHGMKAKCSKGSMENYINTDKGHGVVYQGQPVLNANDHAKEVNLTHFGDCKSKFIFEEAKKQADEKYKAEEGDGFFTWVGKGAAKFASKTMLNVKETFASNKCELDTPLPWIFTSRDHMIDGAPALTMESQCPCKFGGIISIVPQEEEAALEESEQESSPEMAEVEPNMVPLAATVGASGTDSVMDQMFASAAAAAEVAAKEEKGTGKTVATLGDVINNNPNSYPYDLNEKGFYLSQQYFLAWYYGTEAYNRLDQRTMSHNSYLVYKLDSMRKHGVDLSGLTVDEVDKMAFDNASLWFKIDSVALASYTTYNTYLMYKGTGNARKAGEAIEGTGKTTISSEMRTKILEGQRKTPTKNELIGGHSPNINNANPNYAAEVISKNPDGTKKIKFITQFDDGNLSKIKTSTVFPDSWTDDAIIQGIEDVGNTTPIGVRFSDGATLHRDIVNNVQIEVIKIGDKVTSGYPTGGVNSGLLPNFQAPQ